MNREEAIPLLPEPYAVALRLHEAGRDDAIAVAVGIPPETVPAIVRIAEAKLAHIISTSSKTAGPD